MALLHPSRLRVAFDRCPARIIRYRLAKSIPHKTMAGWSRQWLQLESIHGSVRSCKLQTIHNPQSLVPIVRYSQSMAIQLIRCYSITDYNVVISVLSMFILLVKSIMYILHVFPPVLSVLVHALLIALYTVSVDYQASSDTTDPQHPQRGPPWYITKSCSVTKNKSLVGYCQQAKASFACTCAMLGVFVIYFGFAVWSCFPSKKQREEYAEQRRIKAEKWAKFDSVEESTTGEATFYPVPDTPGTQVMMNPVTPRTMAFNTLGGTKDLPLRNHFSAPRFAKSPTFPTTSPDLQRSPLSPGFIDRMGSDVQAGKSPEVGHSPVPAAPQMYFPPPPKTLKK